MPAGAVDDVEGVGDDDGGGDTSAADDEGEGEDSAVFSVLDGVGDVAVTYDHIIVTPIANDLDIPLHDASRARTTKVGSTEDPGNSTPSCVQ